jgi:hypothetical protein
MAAHLEHAPEHRSVVRVVVDDEDVHDSSERTLHHRAKVVVLEPFAESLDSVNGNALIEWSRSAAG